MQFRVFESGIEVQGHAVYSIIDAYASFKHAVTGVLVAEGIGRLDASGAYQIDTASWYLQEAWLRAFARIAASSGDGSLFKIGQRVPENVEFPPGVVDVHSGLRALDIGYHLNHRKRGVVMFSLETGVMLEGIGHYGYERQGDRKIVCLCNNPYPCEFDRGIITAMARRFEPKAKVVHDDAQPCRKQGADSCVYVVSW